MQHKNVRRLRAPLSQTFGGLWLCPSLPLSSGEKVSSAKLFLRGKRLDYMLNFNHYLDPVELTEEDEDDDYEDLVTSPMLSEIRVTPTLIHKHLAGCIFDDWDVDVPWRAGKDGSLVIAYGDRDEVFYPSTFEELYRREFQRFVVEDCLEQTRELGLTYTLEPRLPVFPANVKASGSRPGRSSNA